MNVLWSFLWILLLIFIIWWVHKFLYSGSVKVLSTLIMYSLVPSPLYRRGLCTILLYVWSHTQIYINSVYIRLLTVVSIRNDLYTCMLLSVIIDRLYIKVPKAECVFYTSWETSKFSEMKRNFVLLDCYSKSKLNVCKFIDISQLNLYRIPSRINISCSCQYFDYYQLSSG